MYCVRKVFGSSSIEFSGKAKAKFSGTIAVQDKIEQFWLPKLVFVPAANPIRYYLRFASRAK